MMFGHSETSTFRTLDGSIATVDLTVQAQSKNLAKENTLEAYYQLQKRIKERGFNDWTKETLAEVSKNSRRLAA